MPTWSWDADYCHWSTQPGMPTGGYAFAPVPAVSEIQQLCDA